MAGAEQELHTEFFTRWSDDERILIANMTDDELTAHRNELAKIALESKVRTTTADEEIRQRRAKKITSLIASGKPWLIGSEIDVNSSIKSVKSRQERISKEDKILATLKELGVTNAVSMIKGITDEKIKPFPKLVESTPKINDTPIDFGNLKLED